MMMGGKAAVLSCSTHAREPGIRAYHVTTTLMIGPEMTPVFLPYAGIRAPRLG